MPSSSPAIIDVPPCSTFIRFASFIFTKKILRLNTSCILNSYLVLTKTIDFFKKQNQTLKIYLQNWKFNRNLVPGKTKKKKLFAMNTFRHGGVFLNSAFSSVRIIVLKIP